MDDLYPINLAKTEFQEAWNTGDADRLLAVISDGFLNFTFDQPSFYGKEGKLSLRQHFEAVKKQYEVRLDVIIIRIQVAGDMAVDMGWEDWRLTPRKGGPVSRRRTRYLETWRREPDGQWRIAAFISNQDLPSQMLMAS